MTDRDDRLLRLNAALDGELDAMGSLEFERELRDDPAIAAEYNRITMLCYATQSVVTPRVRRPRKRSLIASRR
jgi:anti-sigma factor RsiW